MAVDGTACRPARRRRSRLAQAMTADPPAQYRPIARLPDIPVPRANNREFRDRRDA